MLIHEPSVRDFLKPFIWILIVLGKVIVALHHSWFKKFFSTVGSIRPSVLGNANMI